MEENKNVYEEGINVVKKNTGLGITALVLSIFGFLLGWIGIGLLLDFIAIILAIIALAKKNNKNGMPIAAMIISILGIAFTLIIGGLAFSKITNFASDWGITSFDNMGTQIEESVEERIEEEIMESIGEEFEELDVDFDTDDLEQAAEILSESLEQITGEDTNGDGFYVMPNEAGLTEEDLNITKYEYFDEYGYLISLTIIENKSEQTPFVRIRTEQYSDTGEVNYSGITRTILPSQYETLLVDYVMTEEAGVIQNRLEVDMSVQEESMIPYIEYLVYEKGDVITIEYTNNGSEATKSLNGTILFFAEEEVVGLSTMMITDDELELKPNETISVDYIIPENLEYNEMKVFLFDPR